MKAILTASLLFCAAMLSLAGSAKADTVHETSPHFITYDFVDDLVSNFTETDEIHRGFLADRWDDDKDDDKPIKLLDGFDNDRHVKLDFDDLRHKAPTPTPEPNTLILLGTGIAALAFIRKR